VTQLPLLPHIDSQTPPSDLIANRGDVVDRLPDRAEIIGAKGSVFYRAHSYHTKVPPEGIARLIEHYTQPGDVVADPFCGSGMTGVACLLTGRRAVLSDLSPAAAHIAANYVRPADAAAVEAAGTRTLSALAGLEAELYSLACRRCARAARTEYVIWSDVHGCPGCGADVVFWDSALDAARTRVQETIRCHGCGAASRKRDMTWRRVVPVHASTSCQHCGKRGDAPVTADERDRILAVDRTAIPHWYPTDPFESWREMWRGQHRDQGIATAADFFTPRNLWALSALWDAFSQEPDDRLRDALRFVFTSTVHRASRRYQWNAKRPTNVLTSTMYVASLSYEFNVFSLVRRKLRTVLDLYRKTAALPGCGEVHLAPAQSLAHLPDASVDYVFTDPPFGSNIFYTDSSFLWEAWLGKHTDTASEAVVNKSLSAEHGGKDMQQYEKLMAGAFDEIARVLRPGAWASVMFHNSSDEVWSALQRAVDAAGFEIGAAVAFDKSQPSFKAVKGMLAGERVPSFDLVLHLRRRTNARRDNVVVTSDAVTQRLRRELTDHVANAPSSRRTTPYLHSLVMRLLLEDNLPLAGWTYRAVEELCATEFVWDGTGWRARAESSSA
jgi:16S rRNA G966 N2-methylase RsmD